MGNIDQGNYEIEFIGGKYIFFEFSCLKQIV